MMAAFNSLDRFLEQARARGQAALICAIPAMPPDDIGALSAATLSATTLSADERARALRLRQPMDQIRFLWGRVLMRGLWAGLLGLSPADVVLNLDAMGRPFCPQAQDIDINLSHSGLLIGLGLCHGGRIGIDLEGYQEGVDMGSPCGGDAAQGACVDTFFHPDEAALWHGMDPVQRVRGFARLWTRKEAVMKAVGLGLALDPAGFSALPEDGVMVGGRRIFVHDLCLCAAGAAIQDDATSYAGAVAVTGRPWDGAVFCESAVSLVRRG